MTEEELNAQIFRIVQFNLNEYGFNKIWPAKNMAIDIAAMVKKASREFYLQKTDK